MSKPGEIIEGVIDRVSNNGNVVVRAGSDTHVLKDDVDAELGEEITIRVLGSGRGVSAKNPVDIDVPKKGYLTEYYAQVTGFRGGGVAIGFGAEDTIQKRTLRLGPLSCSIGDHIPVILLTPYFTDGRMAVCTDTTLWEEDYIDTMIEAYVDATGLSRTTICEEFGKLSTALSENDSLPALSILKERDTESTTQEDSERISVNNTDTNTNTSTSLDTGVESTANTTTTNKNTDNVKTSPSSGNESQNDTISNDTRSLDLTEDVSYTETRRRQRDTEFAAKVTATYDERCAVCGERRVAPNGSTEVEAAHIYPKAEGGVDDVQNGIALCKLHHWAFDNGWFSISDDHDVIVENAPGIDGYDEFAGLDGDMLYLPDNEELRPHPKFLEKHRALHGFEDEE